MKSIAGRPKLAPPMTYAALQQHHPSHGREVQLQLPMLSAERRLIRLIALPLRKPVFSRLRASVSGLPRLEMVSRGTALILHLVLFHIQPLYAARKRLYMHYKIDSTKCIYIKYFIEQKMAAQKKRGRRMKPVRQASAIGCAMPFKSSVRETHRLRRDGSNGGRQGGTLAKQSGPPTFLGLCSSIAEGEAGACWHCPRDRQMSQGTTRTWRQARGGRNASRTLRRWGMTLDSMGTEGEAAHLERMVVAVAAVGWTGPATALRTLWNSVCRGVWVG